MYIPRAEKNMHIFPWMPVVEHTGSVADIEVFAT